VLDPPTISAQDLDIIKLTAQFVARNGSAFLQQLMQREARNYQFDFLKPTHMMFNYFTKLTEQYRKVREAERTSLCWGDPKGLDSGDDPSNAGYL
jgi:splicing factor 3A subunit 1